MSNDNSNALVTLQHLGGEVMPAHLAQMFQGQDGSELAGGIGSSFAVVSIRGKGFRIKWRGDEHAIYLPADPAQGIAPNTILKPFIDVVIVKASPVISKNLYPDGYAPGADAPPKCFSTDGVAPDAASEQKMAPSCATCPYNQWGSKILPDGRKAKMCQDLKRIAVVPLADVSNEGFGGPMLLRVPAGSLQSLNGFNEGLKKVNAPYFAVGTRISFDQTSEYPLLNFVGMRWLTADEAAKIKEMQDGAQVKRILSEPVEAVRGEVVMPGQHPGGPVTQPGTAPAQPQPPRPVEPPAPVAPNPMATPAAVPPATVGVLGVAPVAQPVVAPPVAQPVAPPVAQPVVAPPVAQPVAPPVAQPAATPPGLTPELMEQLRAAGVDLSTLGQVAAEKPKTTRKPKVQPPSPTPTTLEGTATVVPAPVATPQVQVGAPPADTGLAPPAEAQPGAGQAAVQGIASKLTSML